MSCLMVTELSLSEQIELELAWAAKLEAQFLELFATLDSPAKAPHPLTAPASPGAGESNPFHMEPAA